MEDPLLQEFIGRLNVLETVAANASPGPSDYSNARLELLTFVRELIADRDAVGELLIIAVANMPQPVWATLDQRVRERFVDANAVTAARPGPTRRRSRR